MLLNKIKNIWQYNIVIIIYLFSLIFLFFKNNHNKTIIIFIIFSHIKYGLGKLEIYNYLSPILSIYYRYQGITIIHGIVPTAKLWYRANCSNYATLQTQPIFHATYQSVKHTSCSLTHLVSIL